MIGGEPREREHNQSDQRHNPGQTDACPECDSGAIQRRCADDPRAVGNTKEPEKSWRCRDCAYCFNTPSTRATTHGTDNLGTKTLAIADPETPLEDLPELAAEIAKRRGE